MFKKTVVFAAFLSLVLAFSAWAEVVKSQVSPMELQELWRVTDNDDSPFLIGAISAAAFDDQDNVYLLDGQLANIKLFDAKGEFQGRLSRQGEGPGETNNPSDVVSLPDGKIGIVQSLPGKMVIVDYQDRPVGEVPFLYSKDSKDFFKVVYNVDYAGNSLIVRGGTRKGSMVSDSIARHSMEGLETHRFIEYSYEIKKVFSEEDMQMHFYDIYTVDDNGYVYIAPYWDKYTINIYDDHDKLVNSIHRDYEPYRRSAEEIRKAKDTHLMIPPDFDIEQKAMDTERDIVGLHIDYYGRLWVRTSRSALDQPDGVMLTYDVFSPEGEFLGQVPIYGGDDPSRDKFYFFGNNRVLVLKNLLVNSWLGPDAGGPMEQYFICYQLVPK